MTPPTSTWRDPATLRRWWEINLLALLLWREAQNQENDAIIAVACSVRNRVLRPRWWGTDWIQVILCGKQYSSFNSDDPNSRKLPYSNDPVFPRCLAIAEAVHSGAQADTIDGADSYHDKSVTPEWASKLVKIRDVGAFVFYRTMDAAAA